jgi:hypothetical protein
MRRTKESEMMVLRPAVILGSEKGTLLVLEVSYARGWEDFARAVKTLSGSALVAIVIRSFNTLVSQQ